MKRILTPKVLLATVIVGAVLLCSSLMYILFARPAAAHLDIAGITSVLTVIPAPTSTPSPVPPSPTPLPPTPRPTYTPAPGQIAIGVYVQPSTGGEGLRVHTGPALATDFFIALDSEVFLITDGPQQADDYTWWYLTGPYRSGWAVEDYLTAVPQ